MLTKPIVKLAIQSNSYIKKIGNQDNTPYALCDFDIKTLVSNLINARPKFGLP